jgi:KDO2-lipid IV(A) lauroyltransferase
MNPAHLVKDVGGLALYDIGPRVVKRMSRSQLLLLAEQLGDLIRRSSPGDVALMKQELDQTLGDEPFDESADELVKRAYRLRMFNELEVLRYPVLNERTIQTTAFLEGRENLDKALERGKGAIIMIGHFGANQMIMPALGYSGYGMHQISAPPTEWIKIRTDGRVNKVWIRVQERRWALEQTLPAKHIHVFGFLRPAYTCLEENQLLGLAFDGGGGTKWVPMPIGRRKAYIPTQPWQLARSTGAAVVPTVVVRQPHQQLHRVILGKPLYVEKTRDKDADVQRAAETYGEWFTGWLRRRPEHYAHYLLLRRKVRFSDNHAFFDDYPVKD